MNIDQVSSERKRYGIVIVVAEPNITSMGWPTVGACCDVATGQCQASFEVDCGGFLEQFTQGASCENVDFQTPVNAYAVTPWSILVLTLLLSTALTIKFARRRAKCARLQN